MTDPRERFSDRVDDYVRFRPAYPDSLVAALFADSAEAAALTIADIGSGTGIFTRLLLERGARVYAVEPNAAMRTAAESHLADYGNFTSVDGGAEDTGLADNSIDLVTAAQAFHWFNNRQSLAEFQRILKTDGRLALVWNNRNQRQPFQRAYEALLHEHAPEYGKVNHMNLSDDDIAGFFAPGQMQLCRFGYRQRLDFGSLLGRLKSSSYCPHENSTDYQRLTAALRDLFDQHASQGLLDFEYESLLYLGAIKR
ncbi:MAG: class I SAM-dependent methyltransferase [Gammaproteobacteria bacterium]|nr:MAG: class I SAM-dependent methyltransferase [Gammaproteobacteria bacterium]UCH40111.1 MAG: class I SAM-dependent methyltransferase [Gammaproteobacteria bacterium]